ncbi:MAG: hypothetical protein B6242_08460 [Anaerolineaceae bacterium 4572_78]|nr:MAG: hypothetical protein B6242_08460 [Anaerolineaceae bacterium 4572_78]
MKTHIYPITIFYEDTDVTGYVYHPNYFKYFERCRSDFFSGEQLRRMQEEDGIAVVVYRAEIVFKKGAVLGDILEIHSTASLQGMYRVVVEHKTIRTSNQTLLNKATVELVCVANDRLVRLPDWIVNKIQL